MSEIFAEPTFSGGKVKVELNLSSYATKTNLKNARGVHSSKLSLKSTLASFFF